MRLCLVAPYDLSEQALAALRLAGLAAADGWEVTWLSTGGREGPGLDPRRRSLRRSLERLGTFPAEACTWFEHRPADLRRVRRAWPECRHWLVPSWNRFDPARSGDRGGYDRLVCPSPEIRDVLLRSGLHRLAAAPERTTWCIWNSGLTDLRRSPRPLVPGAVRLYVHVDARAMRHAAETVLVMRSLLDAVPQLQITADASCSWPRAAGRELRRLQTWRPQQFQLARSLLEGEQRRLLQRHDWAWFPAPACDFGIHAARAIACGVPPVAWDVPPFSAVIAHDRNGVLLPCELGFNRLQATQARFDAGIADRRLRELLTDGSALARLRKGPAEPYDPARRDRDQLASFWSTEWHGASS